MRGNVCWYGQDFLRDVQSRLCLTTCPSCRVPARMSFWMHPWCLQPQCFYLGVCVDAMWRHSSELAPAARCLRSCSFVSVPWTIRARQHVQWRGKNPEIYCGVSTFCFSPNRSFILVVFSKFPFSQELCQKMALLYAEHPSPLQQVIKRSGKTAARKSIRLSQPGRKRICLHLARQGRGR